MLRSPWVPLAAWDQAQVLMRVKVAAAEVLLCRLRDLEPEQQVSALQKAVTDYLGPCTFEQVNPTTVLIRTLNPYEGHLRELVLKF